MSETSTATHVVIIVDRSAKGLRAADDLLNECPQVNERMAAWRSSDDALFLFIMEQSSGRIGSMTARDLDDMLQGVLPRLFDTALAPPATPSVAIVADGPALQRINGRVEYLANQQR